MTNDLANLMVAQSHRQRVAMGAAGTRSMRQILGDTDAINRMKADPVFKSVADRLVSDPAFRQRASKMSTRELMAQMAPERQKIKNIQKQATKVKKMEKSKEKQTEMGGMVRK